MRKWPSIVPDETCDYYIVVNLYGRHASAFAETDRDRADYETTISHLMTRQHSDPQQVIMFNPASNRSEVSHAVAWEILRRFDLQAEDVPSGLEGFIDRHVGPDRQLTLWLT